MHRNSIAREIATEARRSTKERLTPKQRDYLQRAASSPIGTVSVRGTNGLSRSSQTRCLNGLVERGLLAPYHQHDEYVITKAGHDAIASGRCESK